ncbi:hypothetical protein LEM8419_01485 [Neolewinella maritima]|uniref:ASPIC/UnbV domain-containing protein n=1 Tax=Neolewinella maritima TaxID=1383882 RepID=A0ABM9AZV9_9BACT|nr:VCBS repeat-containing protein [Neolewinella maritima]CAH1000332.1 hypothetical protein LEM8419_01485 [Neolewinella maritima]
MGNWGIAAAVLIALTACGSEPLDSKRPGPTATSEVQQLRQARFVELDGTTTGIDFANVLTEGPNTNILVYEYFYNGGGVATADFNGDGLADLYFTANMSANALYLNRGDWRFEEVTERSGVSGRPGPWQTGVSIVDINTDGRPDIYLSYSGMLPPDKRRNQLFINEGSDAEGVPHFSEQAATYGLDSPAFTNQAYFFDFDGDTDLDALLLNHNPKSLPILNVEKTRQLLAQPDVDRGLRLYRNDEQVFTDVTEQTGINGSALSYGLGIALEDFNQDGLPDIYVSNDYEVPDYLYINQGDGTFRDELVDRLGQSSHFSMGSDAADINNDGLVDLYTLDMLPADNQRRKLLMADDNRPRHALNAASGFAPQTMRNMLHLNRGEGAYAEIGQHLGIATTDWSWSALLADFDNDGWKDLHVTNGYLRDYTNQDFIKYMNDFVADKGRLQRSDVLELLHEMPSSDLSNRMYKNLTGSKFEDVTAEWGLDRPSNSNGAVAVDLDNDGDLDLVTNTVNAPALLYRNTSSGTSYVQIDLAGPPANPSSIGTHVTVLTADTQQVQVLYPNRGYLSSGPTTLHFGLGTDGQTNENRIVQKITVRWPDGSTQEITDVPVDQRFTLNYRDARTPNGKADRPADPLFKASPATLSYVHRMPAVDDLDRQALLPRQLSRIGPVTVVADLDGDGRLDYVVGSDGQQPSQWFAQLPAGTMSTSQLLGDRSMGVVTSLLALDVDGDGDQDIYEAHGGYHTYERTDSSFQDVIWLNNGQGVFTAAADLLPQRLTPGSTVAGFVAADGRNTIFVGGGVVPGAYPQTADSYLLQQQADGTFSEVLLPDNLLGQGIVRDAIWADLDSDEQPELIVCGEWMPITVLSVLGDDVQQVTSTYFTEAANGWWYTLHLADLTGDGRLDLIAGNEGTNTLYQASPTAPLELFAEDLDGNGAVDPLLFAYTDGVSYPDATREELLGQLSGLRREYPNYASYATATQADVMDRVGNQSTPFRTTELRSSLFLRQADATFRSAPLPPEVQYAPVHAIASADVNRDGLIDLVLAGNESGTKLRSGPSQSNAGTLLLGRGDGVFDYVPQEAAGLHLRGDVRSIDFIGTQWLFGRTGESTVSYTLPSDAL